MPSNLTLIFLHIPKTGGQSLKQLFRRHYSADTLFLINQKRPGQTLHDLRSLPLEKRQQLRCVAGHCSFGIHLDLAQPKAQYLTLVRKPVERVISHYYFVRGLRHHPLHEQAKQMSLAEYARSGIAEIDNGQTRMLTVTGDSIPFGACTPELLEEAKQNLRTHFTVVGTTDRFNEVVVLLHYHLGIVPFYHRENETRNRPKQSAVSAETTAAIMQHNRLDQSLYDYANQLLDEQIERLGLPFLLQFQRFKVLNSVYGVPNSLKVTVKRSRQRWSNQFNRHLKKVRKTLRRVRHKL
ncbi:sulfotransferase family 2 domain-containing protein [Oculatella sp. LEGE 06141]|uniref:sulfotransferase family 2 domain-containing protein n=1 Tax=Oculatella sp. LEGE 06141 TaxID=1828648 RepID=UPI0018826490|nr:sulfotransferase family 2 domain-containing protein [Oculatella sp. LEGE 06141]MBE9180299.1 sulfotransferase family 2 domain-containing protein [Oculatella sp. LEGE 06141]